MSANALAHGSRTSALLYVLEPSPGVSQFLPAQPSKRHVRTASSRCGHDFLHLPPVHALTFPLPTNSFNSCHSSHCHGGRIAALQTDHSDAAHLLDILHGGGDRGIKAGGITVENDELNAICAAHQCVVASSLEKAIEHGSILAIRAINDQCEVVGSHLVSSKSVCRLHFLCGRLISMPC